MFNLSIFSQSIPYAYTELYALTSSSAVIMEISICYQINQKLGWGGGGGDFPST